MAKAIKETANDGHNRSCGHWLFVDFSQEVKLQEGNFTFVVVKPVGLLEVSVFIFGRTWRFIFA